MLKNKNFSFFIFFFICVTWEIFVEFEFSFVIDEINVGIVVFVDEIIDFVDEIIVSVDDTVDKFFEIVFVVVRVCIEDVDSDIDVVLNTDEGLLRINGFSANVEMYSSNKV